MDDYMQKMGFSFADDVEAVVSRSTIRNENMSNIENMPNMMHMDNRAHMDNMPGVAGPTSKFDNTMLKDLPLAMAYVPMQKLDGVYEEDVALNSGTLFPVLYKPFLGKRP